MNNSAPQNANHPTREHQGHLPFLIAALIGLSFGGAWSSSHAASLSLEINNMPSAEGSLMIEVVRGEAGFKDQEPPVAQFIVPANGTAVSLSTDALPDGEYGVRVMQDLDGDGELKTNVMGMPTEPWAFSNNATGRFGPPKWKNVKFTLEGDVNQTINLVH